MQEELRIVLEDKDIERIVNEYAESIALRKGYRVSFAKRLDDEPYPKVTFHCVPKKDPAEDAVSSKDYA